METETKKSRIAARVKTLQAIRDGGEFSKADKVLAPLSFGSLIAIKYDAADCTKIIDVKLTFIGEQFLLFYEKKIK